MRKQLSDETYTNIVLAMQGVLSGMGLENGDMAITISTPRICDRCKDESKEAFPYYVTGSDGVRYPDLCNDCFDEVSPRHLPRRRRVGGLGWTRRLKPPHPSG